MFDINLLSDEVKEIFQKKRGYRYEELYGEGYRNVKEVCIHETFELGNSCIATTIITLYQDLLSDSEKHLMDEIANCEEVDDLEVEMFGNICVNLARKVTGKDNVKCIWLCNSKKDVEGYLELFGEFFEDDVIEKYSLPDEICILSDIGNEGALIAYDF